LNLCIKFKICLYMINKWNMFYLIRYFILKRTIYFLKDNNSLLLIWMSRASKNDITSSKHKKIFKPQVHNSEAQSSNFLPFCYFHTENKIIKFCQCSILFKKFRIMYTTTLQRMLTYSFRRTFKELYTSWYFRLCNCEIKDYFLTLKTNILIWECMLVII
jgi:hypothetical protein